MLLMKHIVFRNGAMISVRNTGVFGPSLNAIGQDVPVMALTATATPKVQQDIQKNLGMLNANVYKSSFNRPNLYYEVRPKTKDVVKDIIKYIKNHPG